MNKHTQIEAQLSVYRLLSEVEKRVIDQHLATCPVCTAKLVLYQHQEQLLAELVEQRQQLLFKDRLATLPAFPQQLLVQQTQPSTWLATWRFGYWPMLQRQPLLMVTSLACILLFFLSVTTALDWIAPNPVVAQPTPIPRQVMPTPFPSPRSVDTIRTEIEKSLVIEEEARTNSDVSLVTQFIDPDANTRWQSTYRATTILEPQEDQYPQAIPGETKYTLDLDSLQVISDMARVHIQVSYSAPNGDEGSEKISVVEGRFYRHVGDRWLLTSPIKGIFGERHVLETKYFRITYGEMDARAVRSAASELERMYSRLLATLQLSSEHPAALYGSSRDGKLEFEIIPYEVTDWNPRQLIGTVTSPFFTRIFPKMEPSVQLSYMMFHRLVNPLINERISIDTSIRRENLTWGIRQWLVEDTLKEWAGPTVQIGSVLTKETLPDYYPMRFAELKEIDDINISIGIGVVLMEFIVENYGRRAITPLLQSVSEHPSWEELIPTFFAVSVTEFEAEWNDWLAARYGLEQSVPLTPNCAESTSQIITPSNQSTVQGEVTISGTASDDNFQYYKLEYAPGADGAEAFAYFGGGNQPVEKGILGVWYTDMVSQNPGPYTLRLTVVDKNGNFAPPCRITVIVPE